MPGRSRIRLAAGRRVPPTHGRVQPALLTTLVRGRAAAQGRRCLQGRTKCGWLLDEKPPSSNGHGPLPSSNGHAPLPPSSNGRSGPPDDRPVILVTHEEFEVNDRAIAALVPTRTLPTKPQARDRRDRREDIQSRGDRTGRRDPAHPTGPSRPISRRPHQGRAMDEGQGHEGRRDRDGSHPSPRLVRRGGHGPRKLGEHPPPRRHHRGPHAPARRQRHREAGVRPGDRLAVHPQPGFPPRPDPADPRRRRGLGPGPPGPRQRFPVQGRPPCRPG